MFRNALKMCVLFIMVMYNYIFRFYMMIGISILHAILYVFETFSYPKGRTLIKGV